MLASIVPNKPPTKPAARRIAIIGEAPGTHEVHWHRCLKCGHGFTTEWKDERGWHRSECCTQCFSREVVADPQPFVGPAGWLLNKLLAEVGIDREACFVGNVCQVQPPANDISKFKWAGNEIQGGILQLRSDLEAYAPHFVLLLGNTPLRAFASNQKVGVGDWRGSLMLAKETYPGIKCMATYHPAALLREAGLTGVARFDMKRAAEESRTDTLDVPVDDIAVDCSKEELLLRLSLVKERRTRVAVDIEGGCDYVSCIGFATGPNDAFVVPFIKADGTSYWEDADDEADLWEAVAAVLSDPQVPKVLQNYLYDAFVLAWSYGILIRGLADDIMLKHFELFAELEKSLGFQTSIYTKHPFYKFERKSDDEKVQLTYCGKDCCRTYECCDAQEPMLMPRQREHYQMNLKLLAPLLYMELRGIRFDAEEAARRLAATTKRIYALQDRINREAAASRPALAEFFNALALLQNGQNLGVGVSANQAGCSSDSGNQAARLGALVTLLRHAFCLADPRERRTVTEHYYEPQRWNGKKWCKAGKRIEKEDHAAVEAACKAGAWQGSQPPSLQAGDKGQSWLKPGSKEVERSCKVEIETFEDVRRFSKDSCLADCKRALAILRGTGGHGNSTLSPAQRGELATLLGIHVKVNATAAEGDAQWFLYEHCKLPKQHKKENGKLTDRLASDDEAIIKAWVKQRDRRAIWFLNLRQLITSTKSLSAEPDADGRIRCSYNGVGAETHRLTCYGSPTGSSDLNLQTVTKSHRVLYRADDDHWMAQRDLGGADGWTVAAFMAQLGDETMLRDYAAKLKPAQILVLMLDRGAAVNKLSRDELKPLCKPITEESDWRYFAMKRVQHGGCFTSGHELLTPDGWKPIEQVQVSDRIAVYNNQTRGIWFEQPKQMHSFLYSGNLYTFRGHTIDMTVTAEHRMPYVTNGSAKVITAAEMFYRKAASLPTAGNYFSDGGPFDVNFGRLIAAIQSDGCYTKRGYLVFNFRKQRKIERIETLLRLNDLPFTKCKCGDNTTKFSITDRSRLSLYKLYGKQASAKMLSWSRAAMRGYLYEYPHWDGSIKNNDVRQLFSIHKEHLDWIDTFAHLCGLNGCYAGSSKSGFGSTVHKMSINDRTFACLESLDMRGVEEVVNVPVYCPTVSTGFVMVRRAGKIYASGNSYMMWKNTMSDQILTDSFKKTGKPIYVPPGKCEEMLTKCLFVRYRGLPLWHEWMARELREKGKLVASDGFQRHFYGRKDEKSTVKAALAHLPQYYTTRATMKALMRLWSDPENRRTDGTLIAEPLHTVHDSLIYQFPKEALEWGRVKSQEWFDNPQRIAHELITIPASGTYGESWGEQDNQL